MRRRLAAGTALLAGFLASAALPERGHASPTAVLHRIVQARDRPGLERKLLGAWLGTGACDGRLTFRADGTHEWGGHGPAGRNSAGTWDLRRGAPPPTLVLTCKTSDDPELAGRHREVKLVQLEDGALAFAYPNNPKPTRYTRVRNP
jgi:hypothetical protein